MEQIYNIILICVCISRYFAYDNNLRIILLACTYPLLAWNCYNLSLDINACAKKNKIVSRVVQIIIFSLVINYFQTNEILFDIDDDRRYIIIILAAMIIFYNFFQIFIINEV